MKVIDSIDPKTLHTAIDKVIQKQNEYWMETIRTKPDVVLVDSVTDCDNYKPGEVKHIVTIKDFLTGLLKDENCSEMIRNCYHCKGVYYEHELEAAYIEKEEMLKACVDMYLEDKVDDIEGLKDTPEYKALRERVMYGEVLTEEDRQFVENFKWEIDKDML